MFIPPIPSSSLIHLDIVSDDAGYLYRLQVVVLHESVITSVISFGRFVFQNPSLINEQLIISFSDNMDVSLIFWMVKSVYLEEKVSGNFSVMVPLCETKTMFSTMVKS